MTQFKIKIQSIAKLDAGHCIIAYSTPENTKETTDITIAFLKKRSSEWQTSVMIVMKDDQENNHIDQLTQGLFDSTYLPMQVAIQRFVA
ncbi:hypothetical protein [Rufibacter latericius]|uniref:Uncharacterized protein n=1 Tax=Rufibacter latericius TaxID=2487040 RepID=A0A3M9M8Z3_9BACT|nr:hypothetical protein [Rufibacter latericius]RNI22029.1 hypothetical protein EFB08_23130 [Rufibacter latericius]